MFCHSLFRSSRQSNIPTSGEKRFKYPLPWENKISQMPHPRADKDNQIPTPCPASPPAGFTFIGALRWSYSLIANPPQPASCNWQANTFFAVSNRYPVIQCIFCGYFISLRPPDCHTNPAFNSNCFQDCFGAEFANYFLSDITGKEMFCYLQKLSI